MTIVNCSECGTRIICRAATCPRCGARNSAYSRHDSRALNLRPQVLRSLSKEGPNASLVLLMLLLIISGLAVLRPALLSIYHLVSNYLY